MSTRFKHFTFFSTCSSWVLIFLRSTRPWSHTLYIYKYEKRRGNIVLGKIRGKTRTNCIIKATNGMMINGDSDLDNNDHANL